MKKLLNVSGLLLAIFLVACADFPIEDLNQEQENPNATRAANPEGQDYYWSGDEKIWLDIDYSKMIVGFDNEQELQAFAATSSKANPYTKRAMAVVDVSDENIKQKISNEKSVKNQIYAHKLSGEDTPIYLTGEIILWPKKGIPVCLIFCDDAVELTSV